MSPETTHHKTATVHTALLSGILLFAAAARLYHLDFLSLWTDELWAIVDSRATTLTRLIDIVYRTETHPPGYHFFLHYWQILFGISDFGLRLPSAVAGVLLVWVTFLLGEKCFTAESGLVSAALVASCYQLIIYSQEARANMLVALFCLSSVYCLLTVLFYSAKKQHYVFFWLSSILACYFHYAGTVFVITEGLVAVFLGLQTGATTLRKKSLTLFLPVCIAYIPWIPGTLHHIANGPQELWNRTPTAITLWESLRFLFGTDILRTLLFSSLFFTSIVFLFLPGKKSASSTHRTERFVLLACILIPVLAFFIKSLVSQPIYNHRHFIFVIPVIYLLIVDFILSFMTSKKLCNQAPRLISLILTILLTGFYLNQTLNIYHGQRFKHEYREATAVMTGDRDFIQKYRMQHNVLLIASNPFFEHYLEQYSLEQYGVEKHDGNPVTGITTDLVFESAEQLNALRALLAEKNTEQFYYLEVKGGESDPDDGVTTRSEALESTFAILCRTEFRRTRTTLFSRNAPTAGQTAYPACPPPAR